MYLRNAKNGCTSNVSWKGKLVFHSWDKCDVKISFLGNLLDKNTWIKNNVKDKKFIELIEDFLVDWHLYDNGWWVKSYDNKKLYNYLCQIGNCGLYRPEELNYIR
jgi:hypothetical protein